MSLPRTRKNFPKMKQRGRRRYPRIRVWDANFNCTFDSYRKGNSRGISAAPAGDHLEVQFSSRAMAAIL